MCFDFVDVVLLPIEVEIQAEAEQMLMDWAGQIGRDERCKLGMFSAVLDRADTDNAG